MKNIKTLLITFAAILFFTACEKEEIPKVYDTISGVLTAGENVTTEDLNGLKVFLGRFHDSIDFSSITFETSAIDSVATTTLNADGTFAFIGLTPGNYGIGLEEGYFITGDTALTILFNGMEKKYIQQNIERMPQNNGSINNYYYPFKITLKRDNLSSIYKVKKLNYYKNSTFYESYQVPEFSNNSITDWKIAEVFGHADFSFKLEICTVDNSGNETNTFTSVEIPYYNSLYEKTPHSWIGNPIDIEWIPYSKTGFWLWKDEKPGHYILSEHN